MHTPQLFEIVLLDDAWLSTTGGALKIKISMNTAKVAIRSCHTYITAGAVLAPEAGALVSLSYELALSRPCMELGNIVRDSTYG